MIENLTGAITRQVWSENNLCIFLSTPVDFESEVGLFTMMRAEIQEQPYRPQREVTMRRLDPRFPAS
jgi:hypothetical protein